jgi:hypothetical protein
MKVNLELDLNRQQREVLFEILRMMNVKFVEQIKTERIPGLQAQKRVCNRL